MPYVRPSILGVKKIAKGTDEALFGPIPTQASFKSLASFNSSTTTLTQTPPLETEVFDFEEIDEKKDQLLDDDMIFEELGWITTAMDATHGISSDLPFSPPLSPLLLNNNDLEQDDYILFP